MISGPDDRAVPHRLVDGKTDAHRIEDAGLVDFRRPPPQHGIDEGWDEIALFGAGIRKRHELRPGVRLARAPDAAGIDAVLEGGFGAVDEEAMEMGKDAAEVRRDLGNGAALEAEDRQSHIVEAESRPGCSDPVAESRDLHDALAGQPENEVDDMDAAAQHDRIIVLLAAPALDDLVDAPVIVVGFEMEEPSETAGRDLGFERAKARCAAEDEVRGEAQPGPARQCGANLRELVARLAERLFREDVLSRLDGTADLGEMRGVIAGNGDDVDRRIVDERFGRGMELDPRIAQCRHLALGGIDIGERHDLAIGMSAVAGDMPLADAEPDHAGAQARHATQLSAAISSARAISASTP